MREGDVFSMEGSIRLDSARGWKVRMYIEAIEYVWTIWENDLKLVGVGWRRLSQ